MRLDYEQRCGHVDGNRRPWVQSEAHRGVSTPLVRTEVGVANLRCGDGTCGGVSVWFRRWHGAASAVDFQCRRIEIVQFMRVRPVKPFLN